MPDPLNAVTRLPPNKSPRAFEVLTERPRRGGWARLHWPSGVRRCMSTIPALVDGYVTEMEVAGLVVDRPAV